MPSVYQATRAALDEKKFHYKAIEGQPFLLGAISGSNGSFKVLFKADDNAETLVIYINLGHKAPPPTRNHTSDFMARANYGLVVGNFEMDMDDGEVRYRTSICSKGGELTHSMIITMLGVSLNSVDKYFAGFMMMFYNNFTSVQAISLIESGATSAIVSGKQVKEAVAAEEAAKARAAAAGAAITGPPGDTAYCMPASSPPKKPDQ